MEVLKNRMLNGTPFLKAAALERIRALADNLKITQAEADELTAIAIAHGEEVLPQDAMGRLNQLEETAEMLTLALADLMGGGI